MSTIRELFSDWAFKIDCVKQCYNNPNREVVLRIEGFNYEISESRLETLLAKYGIDLSRELMNVPVKHYDNRPLYVKHMDLLQGKRVSFEHSPSYPPANEQKLSVYLKKHSKHKFKEEREQ